MPKSSWPIPPDFESNPQEFRDFMLELFNHVYGLGDDTVGTLNVTDNIDVLDPILGEDVTVTGDWTFGGSTSGINHTELDNIGTNTHTQIDTHLANTANPHSVTLAQATGDSDDISEGSTNLYYTQARQDDIEAFAFTMGT